MSAIDLKGWVAGRFDVFVEDLRAITNMDSCSGDPEDTGRVARFLARRLEALGAATEFRVSDRATHLIARLRGKGRLRLLIMAHTDTVFPKGTAARRPFRLDQDLMAHGPGVGDDKATVILTLHALETLVARGFEGFGEITAYYNGEEETGSVLADGIVVELARKGDMALVMDTARPGWGIVTQRKGRAEYRIDVRGQAGHGGNAPHTSASAVMELGHIITRLYRMAGPPADPATLTREALERMGIVDRGQFIPESTINVGVVGTSNDRVNVIPGDAFALVDVRSFSLAEQERLDREIRSLGPTVPGTRVTVTGELQTPPMERTAAVNRLLALYRAIVAREYGAEVVEWRGGGISDGNLASPYLPTLDALGVENYHEHTEEETADLMTAVPRTVVLVSFIEEICLGAGQLFSIS